MAESILTSINLAGGSFNVYYDTVLSVHSWNQNGEYNNSCASGWKDAILLSLDHSDGNGSSFRNTLINPIAIFNVGSTSRLDYYARANYPNANPPYDGVSLVIEIIESQYTIPCEYNYHNSGTIIFVA